jgi:lysophospholipase L1-like esterase
MMTYIGWIFGHTHTSLGPVVLPPIKPSDTLTPSLNKEKVTILGGSMAYGWKDPNDNSYLRRAFQALTSTTNTQYTYIDHTLIGGRAVGIAQSKKLSTWLKEDRPNIVVISWGLLDDMYDKTPLDQFRTAIHDEINQSLQHQAVVMIVTPPVVEATATTTGHSQMENYVQAELAVAASFRNANIYTFDVNEEMTTYLQVHGQTWQPYFGDSWHPNQAGHELAGQLLFNDLIQTFGTTPIRYQKIKTGNR